MAKRRTVHQSTAANGGTYTPTAFLVAAIRAACKANSIAALDYILRPTAWAAEDVDKASRTAMALVKSKASDIASLQSALMSLLNVTTLDAAAELVAAGNGPTFLWQHQRIAPLALPGQRQRPSIQGHYEAAVKTGLVVPAVGFADACQTAEREKAIGQRPVRGGFTLYVVEDWDKRPSRAKGRTAPRDMTAEDVTSLL